MSFLKDAISERIADFQAVPGQSGSATCHFDEAFPGFSGHFPDLPIVPAVCLMQLVHILADKCLGKTTSIACIKHLKCKIPVLANQTICANLRISQDFSVQAELTTIQGDSIANVKLLLE